jgi:hypothetical protein
MDINPFVYILAYGMDFLLYYLQAIFYLRFYKEKSASLAEALFLFEKRAVRL